MPFGRAAAFLAKAAVVTASLFAPAVDTPRRRYGRAGLFYPAVATPGCSCPAAGVVSAVVA